ncbi:MULTISPECIES: putative bifunctional diguanylate cyclase/phosphodiesterase [Mycolicibacterium]|uniref:putative bifunctional diguanylate cyclase/phosphodiesterase n=1 Tax=Mycolicibacterium TaxID=1866885 RepID=UPI000A2F62AB
MGKPVRHSRGTAVVHGGAVSNGRIRPLAGPWLWIPIGLTVALAVLLAVDDSRGLGVRTVDNAITLTLSSYATLCAWLAARDARGRARKSWTLMAGALGAYALGDLTWLVRESAMHTQPFPSPADFFYLVFTILAVLSVLTMARYGAGSTRHSKLRVALDGVTIALSAPLLAWIVALKDVYADNLGNPASLVIATAYPVLDIVALGVTVSVLVRADVRYRTVLTLVVAAFALTTIGDVGFAHAVVNGTYTTGSWLDVVWAAGLVCFAAAGQLARSATMPRRRALTVPPNVSVWLPYVPFMIAGTVGPLVVMSGVERFIVPFITAAVCLRQAVAAWENRYLLSLAAERALRDPLTGLANRSLFQDRLAHALMLRERDNRSVAVISLDLDDFKLVNDSLGHPVADSLLVSAGRRIIGCVRTGDTVARVGGDEFALLLEGDASSPDLIAQRVADAFAEPFIVDGHQILMHPSIGVAVTPPDEAEVSAQTLITRADMAMYTAKKSRSSRVYTFDADMTLPGPDADSMTESPDRKPGAGAAKVQLLGELRRAIDAAELEMVYQPKVALRTGRIIGVEALLRWPHPRLGLLYPGAFMSLVRQHGLMRPVSDLVVDKVLDAATAWKAEGVRIPVAVNLFAPTLRDAQLPDRLLGALEKRGLTADMLTVEITEDLVVDDLGTVTDVLQQLRHCGIRVAIDDFGSGYSALSYLRDLPIDEIKLDRYFVAPVTEDPRAAAVVSAVIDLAHDLGIVVVAEGVEEPVTAHWLRGKQCDIAQGYYFGRPTDRAHLPGLVEAAALPRLDVVAD